MLLQRVAKALGEVLVGDGLAFHIFGSRCGSTALTTLQYRCGSVSHCE